MFTQLMNNLTLMHVVLFVEYLIYVLHALLITSSITYCHHAFIDLLSFSC